ncbi:MAG: FKBP-type peptidyl-prolyl cis-trans isomerase [Saprospiraceae bacterium]|nr:FKBP-type peptidyl-prolyl cis-trans isomerase [Saprospiraceae bacterium]MBP8096937.1 FKBP-type peptidyl-prolyl cis-trans isomerase [Saprospiraceae bacterium]
MTNKIILILLLPLMLLNACKKDAGSFKTVMGYGYDILKTNKGRKAKTGDHAYFNIVTMAGDSVLEDTHIYPFTPTLRLEAKPPREIAAIVDMLNEMSIGDSVVLHVPIDSLPFASIEFQSYKEIKHLINLIDLKSDAEFEKDMESRNAIIHALADSLQGLDSMQRARLSGIIRDYNAKKLDAQLKTTDKGVKYIILQEGTGLMPESGDMIEVNYTGALGNELVFDSSFPRGQPYVYRINTGQVIKGWDDGLSNFKEGTEAILFIPSAMGYGATGSSPNIPPDSELIFYVNLYKVRKM